MNDTSIFDDPPYLFLSDAWHRGRDGIWRVTAHARRSRGFLGGRTGTSTRHGVAHMEATLGANMTPTDLEAAPGQVRGEVAHHLPSPAVCPFCGTPQWLDPAVLGVDPKDWQNMEPGRHYAWPKDRLE
ncbi:MAG: hypothetical protein ACP5VP_12265 [Candidatus Limnocylindrales bacterium]